MLQAVGAGAFGGARSGVAQSVADTEYNRMVGQMTAQQQAQAYQQAVGARQQDLQTNLGMAQLQPQLAQQNIGMLQQGNQQDLSYRQAIADTTAQQQQMKAYEPYQRYGFMGEQLTGIMGGYPGGTRMTTQPSASPMQQMLGMGIAGGLGYAGMKNMGMFGMKKPHVLNRAMFNQGGTSAYGRGITSNLVSDEQRQRFNYGGRVGLCKQED